jgi:pyruvate kinase
MAQTVHGFSDTLREMTVPVLLAGQVLEHMTGSTVPTRSEVCHLYEALSRG